MMLISNPSMKAIRSQALNVTSSKTVLLPQSIEARVKEDSEANPRAKAVTGTLTPRYLLAHKQVYEMARSFEKSKSGDKQLRNWIALIVPLVRAIFPNLVATELVSVQPMTGPASLIFYLQFVYGSTKGATKAGTTLFDNPDKNYASEKVDLEVVGNADGTDHPALGVLAYRPVRPGSLTIKAVVGTVEKFVIDDSNGNLYFRGGADTGINVNYKSGAFTGAITWSGIVDADTTIVATYEYDSEGSEDIPQIDLLLTSTPVHAQPRKLRSRYSMEAAANLRLVHGIDAEMELSAVLAEELKTLALCTEMCMN